MAEHHLSSSQSKVDSCCLFGGKGNREALEHYNTVSAADTERAAELNRLTVQERERIFDDIHGVAEIKDETPDFVATSISNFDHALATIPQKRRQALDRALFLKPGIEKDTKFKLMFLRADHYDASKAARRMSQYFEDKLSLFGEDKLVKKITLDDLSEEDMKVFNTGFFMVLDHKDSVGRPIWFCDLPKYDFERPDSLVRCAWYQIMATLEDEVAQMKGVANIAYCPGNWGLAISIAKFSRIALKAGPVLTNLPCLTTSHHYCSNDAGMELAQSVLRKALGKHMRLRSRTHFGSSVEIRYSIMTFGIPCPAFLFSDDESNNQSAIYFQLYVRRRLLKDREELRQQMEQVKATSLIPYPAPKDVLVGRGCPYQNFSGNRMLSHLIDTSYLDRYRQTNDRFEKTCIHMDVIKTIQKSGGRFTERTPDGWKVVPDSVARSKIWSAFRSKLAKQKSSEDGDGTPKADQSKSSSGDRKLKRMRHDY